MALQSTSTALGWARDLSDKFGILFANGSGVNTVRQALDANGWPMIFLSHNANEAEAQPVIVVRIMNINVGATDIYGNATLPFAPHQAEIAFEKLSGGGPIPAFADLLAVGYEVSKLGVKVLDKEIANGTAVTEASMNAANAVETLDSIDWPNKGA